jgi:alpha-1,3-mannosyltransferase
MKVVHVVRQFHPSIGGMEAVVLNIARRHQARGEDDVRVVTLDRIFGEEAVQLPASASFQDVQISRIPYRGSRRYPVAPGVLSEIRDADVVHVHAIDFFYDYMAWTAPLHRKPMVVSTHGGFFHTAYASTLKKLWFQTVTRTSAFGYRRIIATSENDGVMFRPIVAPERLRVIQNGVDIEKFAGLSSQAPGKTILYFGRWSVNKGLVETLDLFGKLQALDPEWRLVLAGREYDLSLADLQQAARTRGIEAGVEFHAAPSDQLLAELMARAQYFVCLSRHEGFGIAPIEAMSAGLIPILSPIPPFEKLVREGGVGLLVDPADPHVAASKVLALANVDDAAFRARREHAMRSVVPHDWRHAVDQYVDEYRLAAGKQAGQAA